MELDLLGKLYALLSALTWAFAVILFKQSGDKIAPVPLNIFKTTMAALLFLPCFWIFDVQFIPPEITGWEYWLLIFSGFTGITVADSLFFKTLNMLGAGMTAIVDCLYSPMVILLAFFLLSEGVTLLQIFGAILIISAILSVSKRKRTASRETRTQLIGILLGAFAIFWIALSVIIMKPILDHSSALWVTELRLVAGTAGLWIQVLLTGRHRNALKPFVNIHAWRIAFPATFLGNFLAMLFWISAFKYTDVNSAAILNQMSTVFIVILAAVFLKEKFTLRRAIAVAMGVGGSLLIII